MFGKLPDAAVNRTGTDAAQTLAGGNFADTLSGLGGDDRLYGHGGNDALDGGAGDDTAVFSGAIADYHRAQYRRGRHQLRPSATCAAARPTASIP